MKKRAHHIPVNIKHAKRLDSILAQNALLPGIHVAQANVDQLAQVQPVLLLEPAKVLVVVLGGQARQEGDRHAVDVAAVARLGGVDVGVGVDPDDGDLAAEALADGAGAAADGADGDAVVAAEGEDQAALGGVGVDLLGDAAGDGRDGLGVLHAAVGAVGAGGGDHVRVQVDRVVAVEPVAELVAQLGQQARGDEGGGGGVDAGFALAATKADGDDAEVARVGEEAGLDHGRVKGLGGVVVAGLEGDGRLSLFGGRGRGRGGAVGAVGGRSHSVWIL